MSRFRLILIAAVSSFATAVVLAAGAHSAPSPLEVRALKAIAAARPVQAVAALPTAAPVDDRPSPVVSGDTAPSGGGGSSFADSSGATTTSSTSTTTTTSDPTATATATAIPTPKPIKASRAKHVFVIALNGPGYQATFGPDSPATYLTKTLRPQGAVLSGFAPVDGADLPNYLAFAGGQPPNAETRKECATYSSFPASATPDKKGIVSGDGCVYPNSVVSLGDLVSSAGLGWRAYAEDMSADADKTASCRHPVDGEADDTLDPRPGDAYATRHNPFVYFHSLLDLGDCLASVKDLSELDTDLKTPRLTPSLAYVAPDLCHDGGESTCESGTPGGLAAADEFLSQWVPKILKSSAYKRDGVLIVAFMSNTENTKDATGALVLSPKFTRKETLFASPFDSYSLLRSVEQVLGLKTIGRSAQAKSFAKLALPKAF